MDVFSRTSRASGGGGAAASPPPLARYSSLHTYKPISSGGNSYSNYTIGNVITAEAPFEAVQLAFANIFSEITRGNLTKVLVAPSSALGDAITPRNAAGTPDNTLWVPLTFDRGGRGGDPDKLVSGGSKYDYAGMPPATTLTGTTRIDRPILSDLVPLKSLTPTDGAFPYLFVRAYSADRIHFQGGTVSITDWNGGGYNGGRVLSSYLKAGDGVTTPSGFASGAAVDSSVAFYAVRFQHRRRGLSVATIGDSTFQGGGGTAATVCHSAPMLLACEALSTADVPVTFSNFAVSGSKSTSWFDQARIVIDTFQPDILEVPTHTPNDTNSQANTDLVLAQALATADYASKRGVVPILSTPIPWNWTSGILTVMLDHIARVQAMKPSYAFVADRYAAVVDPSGTGGTSIPAYVNGTYPYHMLLAGSQAIATQALLPILTKIKAGRPTP